MKQPRTATPEAAVQRSIVDLLRQVGYSVFSTSRVRKRCVRCGHFSAGGDGVDKGLPDLMVTRDGWGLFCGLEVKAEDGHPTPEQKAAIERGLYSIVRSPEQGLGALRGFEIAHDLMGYASMVWQGVDAFHDAKGDYRDGVG